MECHWGVGIKCELAICLSSGRECLSMTGCSLQEYGTTILAKHLQLVAL